MTESTNYKFKLPSSAAGVNDEADIDVISENFSKIDILLKGTTDKSNTSVQYIEITGTTITFPLENGIYFVKNDSTVSGANVTIPANSVFSYNGGYQVDGSTYNALLTMLKGVVSSSGDTFQNIIVSGSNSTGSLSLSYKIDNFAGNDTVQSALIKKQDNLVSGTNIKTINGNSILGSGNLEISGGDQSNYQQKDDVSNNLTTTSPALVLTALNRNSIYQYSNVLTSLTITVPTTPINIDQSIRLIFKATSSTTITVPSGLYFRGDDCNDSYVFIPQDNKVYDIIITYDGFNYNGIVVGTPATR